MTADRDEARSARGHASDVPTARSGPPYDPELAGRVGAGAVDGHSLRPTDIARLRELGAQGLSLDDLALGGAVWPERRSVPGGPGAPEVPVLVLWPRTPWEGPRPAVLACHGGGLVTGDETSGAPGLARWVAHLGIVAVSVGYRLAPEHRYPVALDDVMAVLAWLHREAAALGLDPGRLGIHGISAGGGLAAAATLRARDERLPGPSFQVLQDAMLDDRHHRPSTYEHLGSGVWDRESSVTAWAAYLGPGDDTRGADGPCDRRDVPVYAAPGRAADEPATLAGLPPTYLDVGAADLFRDDVLAFGAALTQGGVPTELHLWPGGWHGFSEMAADSRLGRLANAAREEFVARHIGR